MKISIVSSLFLALGVSMLCGCDAAGDERGCPTPESAIDTAAIAIMTAKYTAEPVVAGFQNSSGYVLGSAKTLHK